MPIEWTNAITTRVGCHTGNNTRGFTRNTRIWGLSLLSCVPQHLNPERRHRRTTIPTDHFQKSLPRMPVTSEFPELCMAPASGCVFTRLLCRFQLPKLEDTLRRYLDSASVVVPQEAFEETKRAVAAFGEAEGPKLQAELATLRDTKYKDSSYISEMW